MTMSQLTRRFAGALCALFLVLAVAACEEEGPMEKAGEAADEAVEDTAEKVEDAAEDAKEAAE